MKLKPINMSENVVQNIDHVCKTKINIFFLKIYHPHYSLSLLGFQYTQNNNKKYIAVYF